MKKLLLAPAAFFAGALALAPLSAPGSAQTTARRAPSGFNLFTVDQEVEIGRQSAVEAERQLKLLNDRNVDRYLNRIIQRLAAVAPGAQYPYQIKAVNASEINAFALPGGPMYVNRGLIAAARSEAELAGVLAHEMSHVALRHGTEQASKAYLGQTGLSILGGLLGKRGGSTSQLVNAVGGFGLNAVFLKFSRDHEYQADATGAEIMARAGYDPVAMADFFTLLRQEQGRDPSKLERFFSSHPPPADRENRIRQLATTLGTVRTQEIGGFASIKAQVGSSTLASAPATSLPERPVAAEVPAGAPISVRVASPSSRFVRFEQPNGFFTIQYPDNWRTYASSPGLAVSMAPEGGVVEMSNGQPAMVYGVIINHYAPFEGATSRLDASLQHHYAPFEDRARPRGSLEDATDDLVRQLLRSNAYLRAEDGSARAEQIDGVPGYSIMLSGLSPVTAEEERVTVFARSLPDDHVIYVLCVTPERYYDSLDRTCNRMVRTLLVNDEAAHRSTRTNLRYGIRPPS
jgi:Zn-dependent protease with chaperone function